MSNEKEYALVFSLEVGEAFTVTFNELSSAGYLWSVSCEDDAAFEMTEDYLEPKSEADQPQIGGGVTKMFNVKALEEGDYELTFKNARPFDESDKQEVVFKVEVKPS